MNVILAREMGMCFGVRDALAITAYTPRPTQVTIHGELVHNPAVNAELERRGFVLAGELDRDQAIQTPDVMITAHGISNARRARLEEEGRRIIDTTCPLVRRAHEAAMQLRDEGRFVVIIGKAGHVEVQGFAEDLPLHVIVSTPDAADVYPSRKIGVICQTTCPEAEAETIHDAIVRRNPGADVRFVNTVCKPTRERQESLEKLLSNPAIEAVVVVGGKHSNNTRKLVERCRQFGRPAFHVESARELVGSWFDGMKTVGLTAGTSTLDSAISEVRIALLKMNSWSWNASAKV